MAEAREPGRSPAYVPVEDGRGNRVHWPAREWSPHESYNKGDMVLHTPHDPPRGFWQWLRWTLGRRPYWQKASEPSLFVVVPEEGKAPQ